VDETTPPPWHGVPPPLEVYREGSSAACRANVRREMLQLHLGMPDAGRDIIDQWNPSRRRHRTEIFCYGPLSCRLYKAGPARSVPGRRPGMSYTEEDWVDEEATSYRRRKE
jgi:hypothetical protein